VSDRRPRSPAGPVPQAGSHLEPHPAFWFRIGRVWSTFRRLSAPLAGQPETNLEVRSIDLVPGLLATVRPAANRWRDDGN
jgi:hypothetical protein